MLPTQRNIFDNRKWALTKDVCGGGDGGEGNDYGGSRGRMLGGSRGDGGNAVKRYNNQSLSDAECSDLDNCVCTCRQMAISLSMSMIVCVCPVKQVNTLGVLLPARHQF